MRALLAWTAQALREWTWMHTLAGVSLGCLALFNMSGALFFPADFKWARNLSYNILQFGLPFLLWLGVADRAVLAGVGAAWAYGLALIVTVASGVWLLGPALSPLFSAEPEWSFLNDMGLFLNVFVPFAMVTLGYAHWRSAMRSRERLQSAYLARARHEQQVQAARLLALQARVDPQLLFDSLQRIRSDVQAKAGDAETILNDLIALLRTMQPHAQATSSSLLRELQLVQAYARVAQLPSLGEPGLTLQCEPDSLSAAFAPMVLLPLMRQMAEAAPGTGWCIRAHVADSRLSLVIAAQQNNADAQAAFCALDAKAIAARLQAVHGDSAQLDIEPHMPSLRINIAYRTEP